MKPLTLDVLQETEDVTNGQTFRYNMQALIHTARLAHKMRDALELILKDTRLSTESETTDLLWRSPAVSLRHKAESIEKRDSAIKKAREALAMWEEK